MAVPQGRSPTTALVGNQNRAQYARRTEPRNRFTASFRENGAFKPPTFL